MHMARLLAAIFLLSQTLPSTAPSTRPVEKYLIHGRVIDATTTKPIDKFTLVMRPAKNVYWQNHMLKHGAGGAFKFPHPRGWNDILIRVWADGYKPTIVRVPEDKDDVEVWLKPAQILKGRVVDSEGKPVADAQVGLGGIGQELSVSADKLRISDICHELDRTIVRTGADGTFAISDDPEARNVVVVHSGGYAEAEVSRIEDPVVLQPWGRIEGQLLRGATPAPGWEIQTIRSAPRNVEFSYLHHFNSAITDASGHFAIDHIPFGTVQVSVGYAKGTSTSTVFGLTTFVKLKAGEAVRITLGGEGRPVVGRLVSADGATVDFSKQPLRIWLKSPSMGFIVNDPIEQGMREAQRAFFADHLGAKYYRENISPDPDGRFRVDRLPQGSYEIVGVSLGTRNDFEVPPMEGGKSDEPLDLGELKVLKREK
jgi:hypothetical protein